MKLLKSLAIASIASLFTIAAANAATFEAYSMKDQKSKRLVLVVSFTGDSNQITDSQLDLQAPDGYALVSAKANVEGAVCVGMAGNKVRIVSPSGGEKALAKSATDYCTFSFAAAKGIEASAAPVFKQSFIECAGVSGIKSCDANISDITQ